MAWALTGGVVTVDHRPLWYAVGVALMVLGFGVVGWVVPEAAARATATAADPGRGDRGGPAALGRDDVSAVTAALGPVEPAAGGAALPLEARG